MVDMILAHNRTGEILHPYTGQSISTDFIVFICTMCVVCHIQADIFAVANITVSNNWNSTNATDTNSCANWKRKQKEQKKKNRVKQSIAARDKRSREKCFPRE